MRRNLLDTMNDSLESVAFQPEYFFKELSEAFSDARKEKKSASSIKRVSKRVKDAIKKHTNMTVNFDVLEENYLNATAYILPVHIDMFFDLYMPSVDKQTDVKRKKKVYAGGVDLKTGKVNGAFSNIVTSVETTTEMVFGPTLEPEEVAAVLLHEIGHVFTTLFLAASYTHGMKAFEQISKLYAGVETFGERATILKRASDNISDDKITGKEIEEAVSLDYGSKDGSYPGTAALIIRITQDDIDKTAGHAVEYTGRVLEQMADEYAMRYGAGRHLATGLDKLHQDDHSIRSGFKGGKARLASSFSVVAFIVAGAFIHPIVGGIALFFSLAIGVLGAWLGEPIYDRPRTRFDKMLQQLSMKAKQKKTSKKEAQALSEEYKVIKEIRDKYSDDIGIFVKVITLLVPPFSRKRNFSLAMAELEKLASSELYIQSQKFRTA